jgi:uncharacterized membrane protein YeaQ/YmgE (transglycosylase-associated protein family)
MIVLLVIVFGAVVGIVSFAIYGSGYGLWWDVILGIAGSVISSSIMTGAYLMNHFGRADDIGFNWYSMTIGAIGALVMIYGSWLYKRANSI